MAIIRVKCLRRRLRVSPSTWTGSNVSILHRLNFKLGSLTPRFRCVRFDIVYCSISGSVGVDPDLPNLSYPTPPLSSFPETSTLLLTLVSEFRLYSRWRSFFSRSHLFLNTVTDPLPFSPTVSIKTDVQCLLEVSLTEFGHRNLEKTVLGVIPYVKGETETCVICFQSVSWWCTLCETIKGKTRRDKIELKR